LIHTDKLVLGAQGKNNFREISTSNNNPPGQILGLDRPMQQQTGQQPTAAVINRPTPGPCPPTGMDHPIRNGGFQELGKRHGSTKFRR